MPPSGLVFFSPCYRLSFVSLFPLNLAAIFHFRLEPSQPCQISVFCCLLWCFSVLCSSANANFILLGIWLKDALSEYEKEDIDHAIALSLLEEEQKKEDVTGE